MRLDDGLGGPTELDATPSVLVVDDEAELAQEIVAFLTIHGIRAESLQDPRAALQQLDSDPTFSVLLSDIRMPEMDGLTLARHALAARDDRHALAVVILTGNGTLDYATEAIRSSVVDFLVKPLRLAVLKDAVLRAAAKAASIRARWRETDALKAQAERAERTRRSFMTMVNHELRTPLMPIIGLSELIEQDLDSLSDSELRGFATEIRKGGERLEHAITRISELTALIDGTMHAIPSPGEIRRLLDELANTFAERAAARGLRISVAGAAECQFVGDLRLLRRALSELLDNAIRFSPEGAEITLHLVHDDQTIGIVVEDTGQGMTRDEIATALRIFQQVDMSLTRAVEGLGIGLPIVARIARLLGGELSIASKPGEGTAATVFLRRAADGSTPP